MPRPGGLTSSAASTRGFTRTSCTRSPIKLATWPADGSKVTPRASQPPPPFAACQRRAATSPYAAPSTTRRARSGLVTIADRLTTGQQSREQRLTCRHALLPLWPLPSHPLTPGG